VGEEKTPNIIGENQMSMGEGKFGKNLKESDGTTSQPAGEDAVVLLGKAVSKLEELCKKNEDVANYIQKVGAKMEGFGLTLDDIGKTLKMPDYKQYQKGPAVKSEKHEEEEEEAKKEEDEEEEAPKKKKEAKLKVKLKESEEEEEEAKKEEEEEEEEEAPKKKEAKKPVPPPADDDGDDDAPAAKAKPRGAMVESTVTPNNVLDATAFDRAYSEIYEAAAKEIGAVRREKR
jgi:cobalamin biosynthesis protein CobT